MTKQSLAINKVYTENGYLMDTHTAVAYNKLAAYRKDTGCVTPAVVVSTASPYKFCNSVLGTGTGETLRNRAYRKAFGSDENRDTQTA